MGYTDIKKLKPLFSIYDDINEVEYRIKNLWNEVGKKKESTLQSIKKIKKILKMIKKKYKKYKR